MNAQPAIDTTAPDPRSGWQTTFLVLTAMLASTILLKFGQVQYLEIVDLIQIVVLLFVFAQRHYRVTWFRPFLRIGIWYLVFAIVAVILTVASLRYDFYLPLNLDPLKAPGFIAISRLVELTADVCSTLYLAHQFRLHPTWLRFTMRVYFWTGMLSAVYSLISYPLAVLGIAELATHQQMHRVKGFFNEGGPYGLYVLSLITVGIVLWIFRWERPRRMRWAAAALLATLLLTFSKAAFCAIIVLILVNMIFAASFTQRLIVAASGTIFFIAVFQVIDLNRLLVTYSQLSATYERTSRYHAGDANFVYGRVAGLFIVPRMVAAHPLTGIGLGNYGNLRNDPQYRGVSVWTPESDDPGLGIWSLTAEVGLPLFLFLLIGLGLPFLYSLWRRMPFYISSLALLQLIVHLFGAQLNLTYPWVITAFALGLIYAPAESIPLETTAPGNRKLLPLFPNTKESHA